MEIASDMIASSKISKAGRSSETATDTSVIISNFTTELLQGYLYAHEPIQLIDTTKLQKERIKHLHIGKERGTSWCDVCNENPEDCPMHGPLHSLRKLVNQSHVDSPIDYSPMLKFPDEVGLCTSSIPGIEYGVCAKTAIPAGTWIGPYEGRLVRPEQIKKDTETEYMWEIFHDGQVSHYLDAREESNSSWMRFIRCARQRFEQNMVLFQYHGCIYYRTIKDVKIGQELLVWYDTRYSQVMGIPVALNESGNRGVNPPKGIVTQERSFGKRRFSEPEPQKVKRIIVEREPSPLVKEEPREKSPVRHTSTEHQTSLSNSVSFKYRNSMYHRGRWYAINGENHMKQGTAETKLDRKEDCTKCTKLPRVGLLEPSCVIKERASYTCAYCDITCSSLTELGKHMEDHVNERPYRCGYCTCTFNTAAALNQHVRVHSHKYPTKQPIMANHEIEKQRA